MNQIKTLENIADKNGLNFVPDYSGRGMFGDTCVGLIGDDSTAMIEEAARRGVFGAKVDNMGKGYIVYYPGIKVDSAD